MFFVFHRSVPQHYPLDFFKENTIPGNITERCSSALVADVQCNDMVRRLQRGHFYAPDVLSTVCTDACDAALADYQVKVDSSCAGETYDATPKYQAPIVQLPDIVRYNFNRTCLKVQTRFCNNVAYQYACAQDHDAARFLGNESDYDGDSVNSCDDCFAEILRFDASSPFYGGSSNTSAFSAFTSSCSKTGLHISSSTFSWTVSSTLSAPSATPTCDGRTYKIRAEDDCRSISKTQGIGTAWLLTDNALRAHCAGFPCEGSLCLVHTCDVHTIRRNDTCDSIASLHNVTFSQLLSCKFAQGGSILQDAC